MEVKIYTTTLCPYCKMAKNFFKGKGIEYKELNVEHNPIAAAEMMAKSRQMGVPVIDIGGKIIVGFDKSAIEKALGLKGG
ncbi:MAG: glutathione S-transferase N-terminal domain-containing protein [Candidatus Aenigmarchaeota archaeon]|nr:glutathione S-transferase N-terminal domain-containing protein [Candidatus Aenigmarchaeota archaeon]